MTFGFDSVGRLVLMGDATGNTGCDFDLAGQPTAVRQPTGLILSYEHDTAGNRVRLRDMTGVTTWGYDPKNRLNLIHSYDERTTIEWDVLDREKRKLLGNGMAVSHQYDAAGREVVLENRRADGLGLAVFSASYDAVGNRLWSSELDGVRVSYEYDEENQLIREQRSGANAYDTTYTYDANRNRLVKVDSGQRTSYLYNAADELLLVTPPSGAPTTSTWDASGNLLTETAGAQVTSYTWDDENRLLGTVTGASRETMAYDAEGKRRRKESGAEVTLFTWDRENVLLETDASLVLQARYVDFPGYWGGLVSQRRGGASGFYGFDLQWSTRVLVSVGGVITDSYAYKAFGEELVATGSSVNPHRFVGLLGYGRDGAERLYVRARYLRPVLGRWDSQDPLAHDLGSSPGLNGDSVYQYVRSNPVILTDPTGLKMWWWAGPVPQDVLDQKETWTCHAREGESKCNPRANGMWSAVCTPFSNCTHMAIRAHEAEHRRGQELTCCQRMVGCLTFCTERECSAIMNTWNQVTNMAVIECRGYRAELTKLQTDHRGNACQGMRPPNVSLCCQQLNQRLVFTQGKIDELCHSSGAACPFKSSGEPYRGCAG